MVEQEYWHVQVIMHKYMFIWFFSLLFLGDNAVTSSDGMFCSLKQNISRQNYAKNAILKKIVVLKGLIPLIYQHTGLEQYLMYKK